MDRRGGKHANILCLLILNKILGAEKLHFNSSTQLGKVIASIYIENFEGLQLHKDKDVSTLTEKIIEHFFENYEILAGDEG